MGKAKAPKAEVVNAKKVKTVAKAKESTKQTKSGKIDKTKKGGGTGDRNASSGVRPAARSTTTSKEKTPPKDPKVDKKGRVEEEPKKRASAIKSAEPKRRVSFKSSPTTVTFEPSLPPKSVPALQTPPPKKPAVASPAFASPASPSPTEVSLESLEVWKSQAAALGKTLEAYMEDISRQQLERTVEEHMQNLVGETAKGCGSDESEIGGSEELESPEELEEEGAQVATEDMEEDTSDEEQEGEGEGEEEEEIEEDQEVGEDAEEETAQVKDQLALVMGEEAHEKKLGVSAAVQQQVTTNNEKAREFATANSVLAKGNSGSDKPCISQFLPQHYTYVSRVTRFFYSQFLLYNPGDRTFLEHPLFHTKAPLTRASGTSFAANASTGRNSLLPWQSTIARTKWTFLGLGWRCRKTGRSD